MIVCECPNEPLLKAYLAGRLDRPTHEAVDEHLDACTLCQSTTDELEAAVDSSFPGLTPPPGPTRSLDPSLLALVDRVKTFGGKGDPGPTEGTVLGNYVLLAPLGGGGMGRVFQARHRLMKRLVAVKVLAPELFRSDGARARFRREVEAAARLTHPHVVAAYDAGEADGRDFLVMEYVEGQNLSELVKRDGPLPVGTALTYIGQAARGLAYAHAAGVVHRDVKPANLLVDAAGVVKVLDMGLARLPLTDDAAADAGLTSTGVVMGTAAFMAPEQAADTHRADERSDVYSLGCCLYYLLTGRPPYDGRTPMEVLFAHREQPIPNLRDARPDCPAEVHALFRAMVAKRPEDRPASMTVVLTRLDALETKPVRRRRIWPGFAAACLLTTAAALVAWPWLRSRSTAPAPTPPPAAAVAVRPTTGAADQPPMTPTPETPPAVAPTGPTAPPAPPARPRAPSVAAVRIAAGAFLMGSPDTDPAAFEEEKPRHKVTISHPFFLAKTKVTQALFQNVMGQNPSAFSAGGAFRDKVQGIDTAQHPVESVRWLDAIRFCNQLSARDGLPPYYRIEGETVVVLGGEGWRLPTEAEWEYASRAGQETRWSFGDDAADLGDYAWFADNSGGATHPVGRKKPNVWGLYDMYGDVPEWCWDRYARDYYKKTPASDPDGDHTAEARVYRGGGWNDLSGQTRSASRQELGAAYGVALTHVGFRVARNAEP